MKILYVLNNLGDGGAEMGLLNLVENGFFAGHDFAIYALANIRGTVRDRLLAILEPGRVRWLSEAPHLRDLSLPLVGARLGAAFKAERPDVVILSLPQANFVGRIASILSRGAFVVSFEHTEHYKRKVARTLMALTAPLVNAVF